MSTFDSPKNTKYLFIDMNSYFASCEQQSHPEYRGKPVAVTPVNCDTGCIISASYEAKAYGVKTGNMVREAKEKCPGLIIASSDTYAYLDYHKKIVNELEKFSPFLTVRSIDEAVIKLSPSEQSSLKALKIASEIKSAITAKVGKCLKSSVGIGPNVFLAKQATEWKKPDGLTEIKLEDLSSYYKKIKLTDIKGINFRMEIRLKYLGFFYPYDLFKATSANLKERMGIMGEYWHLKLHGYDIDDHELPTPKTIGHSHVLEPKMRSWDLAWSVCQKLVEKAGYRLRQANLTSAGVFLGVKFLGQGAWKKGAKISPIIDNFNMLRAIRHFWRQIPKDDNLPLRIGICFFNLKKPQFQQMHLFTSFQKPEDLSLAVDSINDRYGAYTIQSANTFYAQDAAPVRISFGQPDAF